MIRRAGESRCSFVVSRKADLILRFRSESAGHGDCVTQFDRRSHKVQVSIKALEVAEEKEAIAQYGSSDSGATLGDILGTALKRATEKKD